MDRNRKINIKMIGAIFLVVLLAFIFFSKTIYTYNHPTVTAVLPLNGKLNKMETTTGMVDWENVEEIYSKIGGKVDEILVSEGESVKKGQPLVHLSYDEDDIHSKLKELDVSKNKLSVDIETIRKKLDKINRSISDLEKETYEKDAISDYELVQLENKITKKEEEYSKLKILYDAGALTKQDFDNAGYELQNLNNEYENTLKTVAEKDTKANEDIADKEKNRQKQLLDYQYEVEALQQDMKTKNLDLSNLAIQEETYQKTLSDYSNNMIIYAPTDATIISLPFKKGQYINEKQLMLSSGLGSEYKIACDISLDNNFVTAGDICKMNNSTHTLEGVVTKITPDENAKKITVTVASDDISTGETFEVKFEKESADSYVLVPNGAINKDSDGYFVYRIKRRDGILGKEFFAEKLRVYIGDSDSENTVIAKGITFFEPIVLLSDKPFSENDTVKIINEGDFFAE